MNKKIVLSSLSYIVLTFIVAVVWHVVLFGDLYTQLGYFTAEPNFFLGFLAILIQGVVLSLAYPFIFKERSFSTAFRYVSIVGVFFWSSHVVAFTAKQAVSSLSQFFLMETVFLILQFGLYGTSLGLVYRKN